MKDNIKQRLKDIYNEIDKMILSEKSIIRINYLLRECLDIARNEALTFFADDIEQTISSEYRYLLMVKDKPRKRIDAWQSLIENTKDGYLELSHYGFHI